MKNLKDKVIRGLVWSSLDTFLLKGLTFVVMIYIARIIGPKEFGFIGMISIFLGVGITLFDGGMSASLIRTKNLDDNDYSTVYYSNILISLIVYFFAYLISPYIADFYGYEILSNLIKVYCLIFLIMSFSAVQFAIYNKKMWFKKIAKINALAIIIGTFTGFYLCTKGYGAWSIILMLLATETIKTISYIIFSDWKPKFVFSLNKFKYHYLFGYKLMLSGLLDIMFKNIYNVIIGKFYNPQSLGYFERSRQFNDYPSSTLTGITSKVSYPLMAIIKDDKVNFKATYKKIIKSTLFVITPVILILAAISEPLFLIILGKDWLPAVPLFKIISFGSILYPVHSYSLNILMTYGRSDLFLKVEIQKKFLGIASILIMFQFGIIGLVWSTVISSILGMFVNMYNSGKLINYTIKEQLKDLSIPITLSILMYFLIEFFISTINTENSYLTIIFSSAVGFGFYVCINLLIKKSPIHYVIQISKQIFRKYI